MTAFDDGTEFRAGCFKLHTAEAVSARILTPCPPVDRDFLRLRKDAG